LRLDFDGSNCSFPPQKTIKDKGNKNELD
jgi:hypothetical protein